MTRFGWVGLAGSLERGLDMAFRNMKACAAIALSAAMVLSMAACGTSDKADSSASGGSSSSSSTTGYDVSGVKKDDDIAAMLPDSVTKDGKLSIGMDTSYAPAEFLAEDGKTPVASMWTSPRRWPTSSAWKRIRRPPTSIRSFHPSGPSMTSASPPSPSPRSVWSRRLREHVQGRLHVGRQEGQSE